MVAGKDKEVPPTAFSAFADVSLPTEFCIDRYIGGETWVSADAQVRSVAGALYLALVANKSGRYVLYDGSYDHELIAKIGRRQRPDLDKFIPFIAEDKKTPIDQGAYTIDPTKSEKELGLKRE